jgi:hypothetical protein
MTVETIIVAQLECKNSISWFEKVAKLLSSIVKLIWLHKHTSHNKYYYLDNIMNNVSHDAIICNNIEFKPVFGDDSLL